MILWKKQESVEKMLTRYFNQCDQCFASFEQAFEVYFEKGLGKSFDAVVQATHKSESAADDLRREIEHTLYGKALLPESRGDLLGVLETYDGLPNIAETVVFVFASQRTVLPEDLALSYQRLVQVNLEAYHLARKAVDALMGDPKAVLEATKEVDTKESESDSIEREIIYEIFGRNISTGDKLMLKEVVLLIGVISDRAQKVADRIALVAIKRQI